MFWVRAHTRQLREEIERARGEKRDLLDEQTRFGDQAMQLAAHTDELVERLREVSCRNTTLTLLRITENFDVLPIFL